MAAEDALNGRVCRGLVERARALLQACGCGAAGLTLMCSPASAQTPYPVEDGGFWAGPWDWTIMMGLDPDCDAEFQEFSHAALLPTGVHQGKVLMWRREVGGPPTECVTLDTSRAWLFDPGTPHTLIRIDQTIDGSIFCAGSSWQKNGQLLVVGGIPLPVEGGAFPKETYRFRPAILGAPVDVNGLPVILEDPWVQLRDMNAARYYPTAMGLNRSPITMPVTGMNIAGGSTLVLGGPKVIGAPEGNDMWEINTPNSTQWSVPISPQNPFTPIPPMATPEEWTSHSVPGTVPPFVSNERFDSYPRSYQLTNGQIFVAADVNTVAGRGINTPGQSWVVENPDILPQSPARWELWGSLPIEERFYVPAVLLHIDDPTLKNRVLLFGGSKPPEPPALDWIPLATVDEFIPGSNAREPTIASWQTLPPKAPLLVTRVYHNAVVLPTGQILIEGGSSTDYTGGHGPNATLTPLFAPELYDPGTGPADPGSSTFMNASVPANVPGSNPPIAQRTPRLYHHVSVLLPDGRVFVAGGEVDPLPDPPAYPSPLFSGEMFSPPYLFHYPPGTRPAINDAPTTQEFNNVGSTVREFDVDITKVDAANTIDRVVLLRPAAFTHHFDTDQRYIELSFFVASTDPVDPEHQTLTVTSMGEDHGPPGWYMLFVIEQVAGFPNKRVPSVAWFVKFT